MLRKASTNALQTMAAARERCAAAVPGSGGRNMTMTMKRKKVLFPTSSSSASCTTTQRDFSSFVLNTTTTTVTSSSIAAVAPSCTVIHGYPPSVASTTTTTSAAAQQTNDGGRSFYHNYPQPMPAVAYDTDYFESCHDDETEGYDDASGEYPQHTYSATTATATASARHYGKKNSSSSSVTGYHAHGTYPPPSRHVHSQAASYHRKSGGGGGRGGGGGGTGRHRCPKCGTTVTFRSDLEDNTFYCASCSGWFVADPRHVDSNAAGAGGYGAYNNSTNKDGSSYEEFLAKNNNSQPKKGVFTNGGNDNDPEILMRHVSPEEGKTRQSNARTNYSLRAMFLLLLLLFPSNEKPHIHFLLLNSLFTRSPTVPSGTTPLSREQNKRAILWALLRQ